MRVAPVCTWGTAWRAASSRGVAAAPLAAARDWSRRRPLSASRLPPATRTCWRLPEPPLTLRSQRPARGLRVAPPPPPPVDHGVAPQSRAVRTQGHASQSKLSLFLFLAPRGETHRLNPASDARGPRRSCLGPSPAGEQPGHRPAFMPLRVLWLLPLPAKPLCPPAGGGPSGLGTKSPPLRGRTRLCGAVGLSRSRPARRPSASGPAQNATLSNALCLPRWSARLSREEAKPHRSPTRALA